MKLYLIGGLGADERVFRYLKLNCETQVLNWITPNKNENLESYSNRLLHQINQNEYFGILGVSFGGIVAIELSKLCNPNKLILVSSVETDSQLPKSYVAIGKTGVLNLIPNALLKPPNFILAFLFGAKNNSLLKAIVRDTKPAFIRWALHQILDWSNYSNLKKPIRIHGTNDKLIPLKGEAITIKNGGHFMIVDKAEEVSNVVNNHL